MIKELVVIDHKEYGLEERKALDISAMFKPMLDKMVELEEEFNTVQKLDISPETCKAAKDLRLKYVKVRTGTAAIHKDLKQFYLQGGRFVDGWKNAQLMASQGIEEKLKAIEEHYERIEAERITVLHEERLSELMKYDVEAFPENLGAMEEEVWINYLTGTKVAFEKKKEAEEQAEKDRIEREKAEAEEQERVRKENEKLKAANKKPALFQDLVLGISKVALTTDSFLSAASFEETSRILIKAAITGQEDDLRGLKENVIIGKLIPVGTGWKKKE